MRGHSVPYQTSNGLGWGCGPWCSPSVCAGCTRWWSDQGSSCSGRRSERWFGQRWTTRISDPAHATVMTAVSLLAVSGSAI